MAVNNPIPTTMAAGQEYAITVTVDSTSNVSVEYNDQEILASTEVTSRYTFSYTPTVSAKVLNLITESGVQGTIAYAPKYKNWHTAFNNGPGVMKFRDIEGNQGWSSHMTLQPEYLVSLDDNIYAFNDGRPWVHAGNSAEFFGTQYDSVIAFRVNGSTGVVEVLEHVSLETDTKPVYIHIVSHDPYNQATDLCTVDLVHLEGIYYAPVLRDKLSPNFTKVSESANWFDALIRGDKMRSKYFDVFMIFNKGQDFKLKAVNVGTSVSAGHRKENK